MEALLRTPTEEGKREEETFSARIMARVLEWEKAWAESNASLSADSTCPSDEAKS